jgi:hypothetical protein
MNKYRIKKTDILHNGKVYAEGSEIELEDDVAGMLDNYLELIEVLKKAVPAPKSTPKPKPVVEKQEVKPADNTQNYENNDEKNKNNTQNFVPPNMRKE